MLDADHPNTLAVSFDPVDDAVCASAGRVVAGELSLERLAHSMRVLQKRADHELDDGRSDA